MELLLWLEQIAIWRLQRKEKTMANDKITGNPKAPTGIYMDPDALGMYQRATDEYRRVVSSDSASDLIDWVQSVINDAKHGRRR